MATYQIDTEKSIVEFIGQVEPENSRNRLFFNIFTGITSVFHRSEMHNSEENGIFRITFDYPSLSKHGIIKIKSESEIYKSYSGEKSSEYKELYQNGIDSGIVPINICGHLCIYIDKDGNFLNCPDLFYAWAYQEMKLKRVEYDPHFIKFYLSTPRKSEKVRYEWGSNPNKD